MFNSDEDEDMEEGELETAEDNSQQAEEEDDQEEEEEEHDSEEDDSSEADDDENPFLVRCPYHQTAFPHRVCGKKMEARLFPTHVFEKHMDSLSHAYSCPVCELMHVSVHHLPFSLVSSRLFLSSFLSSLFTLHSSLFTRSILVLVMVYNDIEETLTMSLNS